MKPEEMFQHLKELSERLNIKVSEQNLRVTGVKAQSGFCRVKNQDMFILDKNKSVFEKNILLASFLAETLHDDIYVVPAVREYINKYTSERAEE